MQPTQRFKKTLLASAVLFGTGITLNASAALFTVSAEAVPDVAVAPVVGTQVSFGQSVIGNKNGGFCELAGISHISDADMLNDLAVVGQDDNATAGNLVTNSPIITGVGAFQACLTGSEGEIIVLEIDGADASTVQVTVPDVTGTGWVYTPTAESCVFDYDRGIGDDRDLCISLATNTVTGIGMSAAQASNAVGDELFTGQDFYPLIEGKTRMVLAGRITLTADIGQGTVVSDNILVQVTYE
jgi:hypothetical protein